MKIQLKTKFWEENNPQKLKEKIDKITIIGSWIITINIFYGLHTGSKIILTINILTVIILIFMQLTYNKYKKEEGSNGTKQNKTCKPNRN